MNKSTAVPGCGGARRDRAHLHSVGAAGDGPGDVGDGGADADRDARRQAHARLFLDGEHGFDRDRGRRRNHAGDRRAAAACARAQDRQDDPVPGERSVAGRARLPRDRRYHRRAAALPSDRCVARRGCDRAARSAALCDVRRRARHSPLARPGPAHVASGRRRPARRGRLRGAGAQHRTHPVRQRRRRGADSRAAHPGGGSAPGPQRISTAPAASPSCPSRGRASTRSRSAPCTPG